MHCTTGSYYFCNIIAQHGLENESHWTARQTHTQLPSQLPSYARARRRIKVPSEIMRSRERQEVIARLTAQYGPEEVRSRGYVLMNERTLPIATINSEESRLPTTEALYIAIY